jgi:hypothetical protein
MIVTFGVLGAAIAVALFAVRHGDSLVVLRDELDATGIYFDWPTPKITTPPLFDAIRLNKKGKSVRRLDTLPLGTIPAATVGRGSHWTRVWIPVGAALFIFALLGSAVAVPQLRLLHAFQAMIYVSVIFLARRESALGFGAGITIAVAWNSMQLFITHLMEAGARELWNFVTAGYLRRPDTLMVFIGGIGHFILIVACLIAFRQLRPAKKEWGQFSLGGLLVLAYFAVIVATMLPR